MKVSSTFLDGLQEDLVIARTQLSPILPAQGFIRNQSSPSCIQLCKPVWRVGGEVPTVG